MKKEIVVCGVFITIYLLFILINIANYSNYSNDLWTILSLIPHSKIIGAFLASFALTILIFSLLSFFGVVSIISKKSALILTGISIIASALLLQNFPPFSVSFPNGQAQNIGGWIVQLSEVGAERDIDMLARDVAKLHAYEYIGYDDVYIKYKGKTIGTKDGKNVWVYNFEANCDGKKSSSAIIYYPDTHLTEGGDNAKMTFYCDKPIILDVAGRIDQMGEADPYKYVFDIYVQSCRAQDTTLCDTAYLKEKPRSEPVCQDGETRTMKCQYSGKIITTHICKNGLWEGTSEKCPEGISGNWDIDDPNWGSKDEGDHEDEGDKTTPPPSLGGDGGAPSTGGFPPSNGSCGENAYVGNDGKCYCNDGYMFLNNQCVETPPKESQDWLTSNIILIIGLGLIGAVILMLSLGVLAYLIFKKR